MTTISRICVFSFEEKDSEGKVVLDKNGKPVKHYRFTFRDGDISANAFDDSVKNEAVDVIYGDLDPKACRDKHGRPYRVTTHQLEIDFRPVPSENPDAHRAFINAASVFVPKARTLDFGI